MTRFAIAFCALLTLAAFDSQAQAPIWSKLDTLKLPGANRGSSTPPHSMAVAANGDVVAVGGVTNGFYGDAGVVRYSASTGTVAWVASSSPLPDTPAFWHAVAIDAAGDVVATGTVFHFPTSRELAVTTKYNGATGARVWTVTSANLRRGMAVAAGPSNHVYVTGTAPGNSGALNVLKLDANSGATAWLGTVPGGLSVDGTVGNAIVVDAAGNAYVAGIGTSAGPSTFHVARFAAANGEVSWVRSLGGSGGGARDLRIDSVGDVVAVGAMEAGAGLRFCAVKLVNATGVEAWTRCIEGSGDGPGRAHSVSLDAIGDAYATGFTQGLALPELRTVKFAAATGVVTWSRALAQGVLGRDDVTTLGHAIAGATSGMPVVTGELRVPNPGGFDFTTYPVTIRYASGDGTPTWTAGNSDSGPQGYGIAVSLDAAGDVSIAGVGANLFGVRKYAGATGTELWAAGPTDVDVTSTYSGPQLSLRDGRLASRILVGGTEYRLVLRDAATGNTTWSAVLDFLGAGSGASVGIDASGNVATSGIAGIAAGGSLIGGWARTTKRSVVDGSALWSVNYVPPGILYSRGTGIAVDGAGHVAVRGDSCASVSQFQSCVDLRGWVRRHDGGTGALLWHADLGSAMPGALAVDASGNVAVGTPSALRKLDAASGTALWQVALAWIPTQVLVEAGDVVAVGRSGNTIVVTRRAGATGSVVWETAVPYDFSPGTFGGRIALAPGGDVIVLAGAVVDGSRGYRIARLAAGTGAVLWSRREARMGHDVDPSAAAIDPAGHVHVAVTQSSAATVSAPSGGETVTLRVAKFHGASGAALSDVAYTGTSEFGVASALLSDGASLYLAGSRSVPHQARMALTAKLGLGSVIPFSSQAVANDFDGDGGSDLLWNRADGRHAVWLMDGTVPTQTAEIFTFGVPWVAVATGDINGDGRADILFQRPDGGLSASLMNGVFSEGAFPGLGIGWHVVGAGDLDGNHASDLVFRHDDGRAMAWTGVLAGTAGRSIILGAGSGWAPLRLADFDADGMADILWRHTDGSHAIWLMEGNAPKSQVQILNAGGWTATHTPDLDGDGRADIVWQHTDGTVAAWIMNGTAMASGATILNAGGGWTVTHVGDFDGDGKGDLYFQHTDGRAAIYLMNGLFPTTTTQILNAGSGWSARRLLDLDGDGKVDIVWEHTDGRVAVWLMNGTAMASGREIIGPGTGWSVTPSSP